MFRTLTKNERAEIRKAFAGITDHVTIRKDNSIVLKKTFFYRNGGSAEMLADVVRHQFPKASILEAREYWNQWPRESYWRVEFGFLEEPTTTEAGA